MVETSYCKKVTFSSDGDNIKLFGLITKEDEHFIYLKTGNKNYVINKKDVHSIEDTTIEFREEVTE